MSVLTASQIDLNWLESATLDNLKSAMKVGGEVLAAVNALLLTPEGKKIANDMLNDPDYIPRSQRTPDPEEAAQIAADEAVAQQQAAQAEEEAAALAAAAEAEAQAQAQAQRVAVDTAAEDAEAAAAGVTVHRDTDGRITKLVKDYQATDEDNRPIGRPTHLEAKSWAELAQKDTVAHINAVRYAERVKSNRFKQSAATLSIIDKSAAAKATLEESGRLAEEAVNTKDPAKFQEATKKAIDAEREAQESAAAYHQHGKLVAESWMQDHVEDFLPCEANSKIMGSYLLANGLNTTYDNLETAFQAVKTQLSKPEKQPTTEVTSAAPVINPPAAAPAAPPAPAASITPPALVATVPASTPVAVVQPTVAAPPSAATAPTATPVTALNTPQVTRRPAVNTGLQPGAMSAARPVIVPDDPSTTRSQLLKEIGKMAPEIYRKKLKDTNYVAKLKAAGIPVVGQ